MAEQDHPRAFPLAGDPPSVEREKTKVTGGVEPRSNHKSTHMKESQESNGEGAVGDEKKMRRDEGSDAKGEEKKPSLLKRYWSSLGLDLGTLLMMAKGACSPVIGLALFQFMPFAATFPTIGYLVAIAATLSMPILPRSKFVQTMTLNVVGICVGACIALLTCYCAVQARLHTSITHQTKVTGATGTQQAREYSSSASAVAGIWLFFNILVANALRFSRPQLQTPVILYSIFANISGTFAPIFGNMTQSIAFVKMLIQAFLSGFAISTVVHFVVIPMSCRQVFFKQTSGWMKLAQAALIKHRAYLAAMERSDMLELTDKKNKDGKKMSKAEAAANEVRNSMIPLAELHAKIRADMRFVKREAAFGKLNADDLDEFFTHLRHVLLPLIGLASVADIFTRITKVRGWVKDEDESKQDSGCKDEVIENENARRDRREWNEIMDALHQPFEDVTTAIVDGLNHAAYVFELEKSPKESKQEAARSKDPPDVEAASVKKPGDANFSEYLESQLHEFNQTRMGALRTWCSQRGIVIEDVLTPPAEASRKILEDAGDGQNRRQLYLILYMEYLLAATAKSALKLVKFADSKVEDGTMKRTRFIFPGWRRLLKWLKALLDVEDGSSDHTPDSAEAGVASFALGDAFYHRRDPEHLEPTTTLQRLGGGFRKVTGVLHKAEVAFGFRVACATMSIAILAYLETTQTFFIQQRVVWAMIMVAIGMTMTTGAGVFGFIGRVCGTFIAMCTSLVIWYMAGGRGIPGAVLPILYVFCFLEMYIIVKQPRFIVIGLLTIVTQILILGYELQAETVGVRAVSANGQLYYPIYELAPYRLATVAAGCTVAFIWTYFPYPITARTALRRQLGETIYLLANFYSCVHTSIQMRLSGSGGDPADKHSPAGRLEKARSKVLGKMFGMLGQLRQHSTMLQFEFNLGGKFPKKTYDSMIDQTQHLLNYTALLDFSTRAWDSEAAESDESRWAKDLKAVASTVEVSSHEIIGLLALISSSMVNATPLPPYMRTPKPYELTKQIIHEDREILGLHHILERGYAAFAVTQVCSRLLDDDLGKLLQNCRDLVGEVDFSFHIISSTASSSQASLNVDKGQKGKRD